MKYNSKSGMESRMKNGFSAMNVFLRRAKYKFMTLSDTSEFAKTKSYYYYYYYYYYILTDRNENAFDLTSAYISHTLTRWLDMIFSERALSILTAIILEIKLLKG